MKSEASEAEDNVLIFNYFAPISKERLGGKCRTNGFIINGSTRFLTSIPSIVNQEPMLSPCLAALRRTGELESGMVDRFRNIQFRSHGHYQMSSAWTVAKM